MMPAQGGDWQSEKKKTEILHQPSQSAGVIPIILEDTPLKITDKFVYLGSMITSDGNLDGEIQKRLASATFMFYSLQS